MMKPCGRYLKVGRFNWYPMVLVKNLVWACVYGVVVWFFLSLLEYGIKEWSGRTFLKVNYWTLLFDLFK